MLPGPASVRAKSQPDRLFAKGIKRIVSLPFWDLLEIRCFFFPHQSQSAIIEQTIQFDQAYFQDQKPVATTTRQTYTQCSTSSTIIITSHRLFYLSTPTTAAASFTSATTTRHFREASGDYTHPCPAIRTRTGIGLP